MSSMNIDSPTCMNQLPMVRRFNKIQKRKSNCSSSSSLSLSSLSTCNSGASRIRMALLNQLKNQHTLNDLNVNFDNAYDYIEESDEILPCSEEQDYNPMTEVFSTTTCMEEESAVCCDMKMNGSSDIETLMINSNDSMLMSGSTASHVSQQQDLMMTSSSCITAVKAKRNLRLLTSFNNHRTNFFMDEEVDNYFVELESKINDWLDEQGVLQVEPNSKKMSSSSNVSIDNPFSTSSLIQRRKLRNLGNLGVF